MTPSLDRRRDRTERWFVQQGLPLLIDDYSVRDHVLTRMAPFLSVIVVLEFLTVYGDRWAGWAQALALLASVALVTLAFAVVNHLRGRDRWALPDRVGLAEVVLYLLLPLVPAAIGAGDDRLRDVGLVLALNVVLLAVGAVVTGWGLIPMMRWSIGQMASQVRRVVDLSMKSLPFLVLFSAFIFLNAEMWQVANDFTLPYFGVAVGLVAAVAGVFLMVFVGRLTVDLARFSEWHAVRQRCVGTPVEDLVPSDEAPPPHAPPLSRQARWNVALLLWVSQAIQIVLVAVVISAFYLVFGLFVVREETLLQWTTAETLGGADWVHELSFLGDRIVFTRQLFLVATFVGMLSGLQFTVQVVTDEAYREDVAEGMTAEIREALAVRAVYHRVLVESTNH